MSRWKRKALSPHLLPGGEQGHFSISWHCSHLLPVFKLAERAGIFPLPSFLFAYCKATAAEGPRAGLGWQFGVSHRSCRLPGSSPPQ